MSWQTLLIIHLLCSTTFALFYRRMAENLVGFGRIVTAIMYICIIAPCGIIFALVLGDISFDLAVADWAFLIFGGVLFAFVNFLAYRANEELDAAQFAIITNMEAIFTIVVAGIFLGERLSNVQLAGALILTVAAMDVAIEKIGPRTFKLRAASLIAIGSSLFLAAALTNEKALLGQMTYSTYMLLSWPMQAIVMVMFAWPGRKKIKELSKERFRDIAILGFLRLGAGLSGLAALRVIEVSMLSSVRSYKPILVFIAAFIFLVERKDFWRRAIGAVLATVGLLMLIG